MLDEYKKIRQYDDGLQELTADEAASLQHLSAAPAQSDVDAVEAKASDKEEPLQELSPEELKSLAHLHSPLALKPEKTGLGNSILSKLVQGMTLNTTPYMMGAMGAVGQMADGGDLAKIKDAYGEQYKKELDLQDKIHQERPILSTVANVAGGVATMPLMPAKFLAPLGAASEGIGAGRGLVAGLGQIAKGATNAAIQGSAMGAIGATSGGGLDLGERADNALTGAKFGAVLGGSGEALGMGVQAVKRIPGKINKEFPLAYRAMETGLEGRGITSDKFINGEGQLVDQMDNAINKFRDGIKTVDTKEAAIRQLKSDKLSANIAAHKDEIESINTNLNDTIEKLKASEGTRNKLDIANLIEDETAHANNAIERIGTKLEKLADQNTEIFGNIGGDIKILKESVLDNYKKQGLAEKADIEQNIPNTIKNKYADITKDWGKNLSSKYKVKESEFDSVTQMHADNLVDDMINDYVKTNGTIPTKDIVNSMTKNAKGMSSAFNFDPVDNPLTKLKSTLADIVSNSANEADVAKAENIYSKVSNYFDGNGISMDKFSRLVNTSQDAKSGITQLSDSLKGDANATVFLKALRDFNGNMREARNFYLDNLPPNIKAAFPNLASEFRTLNSDYSKFAEARNLLPNSIMDVENNANSKLTSAIKQYAKHGEIDKGDEFRQFLSKYSDSPVAPIVDDLDQLHAVAQEHYTATSPEKMPDILGYNNAIENVKSVAANKNATPTEIQNLLNLSHDGNMTVDQLQQILANKAQITKLSSGPSNPANLAKIEQYKSEIRKLLNGENSIALPTMGEDFQSGLNKINEVPPKYNVVDKTNALLQQKADIAAGKTPEMNNASIEASMKEASLNSKYSGVKNDINGNPIKDELADIFNETNAQGEPVIGGQRTNQRNLDQKISRLEQINKPASQGIVDDLMKVRADHSKISHQLRTLIEKGGSPKELKIAGSSARELADLVTNLQSRLSSVDEVANLPEMDTLRKLALDLKLSDSTELRGNLSSGSLGFIKSALYPTINAIGLVLGKIDRTLHLSSLVKSARSIPTPNAEMKNVFRSSMLSNKVENNTRPTDGTTNQTLQSYQNHMRYNSVLSSAGTNMAGFEQMSAVQRAAILNALMQDPNTREEAKKLQEQFNGR